MKQINTKKKVVESKKVVITLSKPYLLEGKVVPAGTKILVESADIYDTFSAPPASSNASNPDTSVDVYTMRRMARMRKMEPIVYGDEYSQEIAQDVASAQTNMEGEDDITEEFEDFKAFRKMQKMRKMAEPITTNEGEGEGVEGVEGVDETEAEMEAMRRMRRMNRMNKMNRMRKMDKEQESEDADADDKK